VAAVGVIRWEAPSACNGGQAKSEFTLLNISLPARSALAGYDLKRNPDVPCERPGQAAKLTAAEIDRFAPILLSAEPPGRAAIEGAAPPWLHWTARASGGSFSSSRPTTAMGKVRWRSGFHRAGAAPAN
jgi:hypothetical protein